jgi:hypothetical protein
LYFDFRCFICFVISSSAILLSYYSHPNYWFIVVFFIFFVISSSAILLSYYSHPNFWLIVVIIIICFLSTSEKTIRGVFAKSCPHTKMQFCASNVIVKL